MNILNYYINDDILDYIFQYNNQSDIFILRLVNKFLHNYDYKNKINVHDKLFKMCLSNVNYDNCHIFETIFKYVNKSKYLDCTIFAGASKYGNLENMKWLKENYADLLNNG